MKSKELIEQYTSVLEKEIAHQGTDDWKKILPPLMCDLIISIGHVFDEMQKEINSLREERNK